MLNKMNKLLLAIVLISLISVPFSVRIEAASNPGFTSLKFDNDEISLSDNQVSDSWNQLTEYQNLSEFGSFAYTKFGNNETHLFSLIVAPINSGWVSIEFDADPNGCMQPQHDTWVFYINSNDNTVEAKDSYFMGTVLPTDDAENNLFVEYIFLNDLVYIEIIRALDTGDGDGFDFVMTNGTYLYATFASQGNHFTGRTIYYIYTLFLFQHELPMDIDLEPDINLTDWKGWKNKLFLVGILWVIGFILLHFTVRIKLRPLKHKNRLIDSTVYRAPNLVERWNNLTSGNQDPDLLIKRDHHPRTAKTE